jgi:hypothetical protein
MGAAAVSRWHQRLAELRVAHAAAAYVAGGCPVNGVQNVQNVQNPAPSQIFEHSEQIEQPTVWAEPKLLPAAESAVASYSDGEDERAAIVEYKGSIPREWAEGIAKLDPNYPPADVPARRWLVFISDCGQFLGGAFAAQAAALGWTALDIFGCDRDRPFAWIDQTGLLWLFNGKRLIAMSDNTATLETNTGARQTWRRKPTEPGRALPWELANDWP